MLYTLPFQALLEYPIKLAGQEVRRRLHAPPPSPLSTQYADYENTIAEWILRRLGVVLITLMPLWVAYHRNLHFFGYIELGTVSYIFKGKVGFGKVRLG